MARGHHRCAAAGAGAASDAVQMGLGQGGGARSAAHGRSSSKGPDAAGLGARSLASGLA